MPGSGGVIDPLIDIAIVTWNTRQTTLDALGKVSAVTSSEVRVLVRDNGSTDGTAEAIAKAYPDIELDAGDRNLGFAGGVNTILARSTARWVMLLNSDAWPEPGALEELVACADRHPRAAAVAPRLLRPDGSPEVGVWPFPSVRTTVTASRPGYDPMRDHDEERAVDWAIGAALLIRRSALEHIGQLDDSLFMYAEDLEWCWHARELGWEIWQAPKAVVRHVGNVSGAQRYGARQAAKWIPNSVVVYRRRHSAAGTWLWQVANAVGAAHAARKARRQGDDTRAQHLGLQSKAWLRPRHFADESSA